MNIHTGIVTGLCLSRKWVSRIQFETSNFNKQSEIKAPPLSLYFSFYTFIFIVSSIFMGNHFSELIISFMSK